MNFFERQRQVKRLSWQLVFLFGLAVVAIIVIVDVVAVVAFSEEAVRLEERIAIAAVSTVITGSVIGLASLFKTLSLRSGGGPRVAEALGGTPVPPDTTDPQLRRLRNVVEEVAIASGTPVPAIYVLEDEPGINAFAAGWSPSNAAIAVTRGALDMLNRDELQGVIAHEFSHIANGDMRLNIRLMGLLYGILLLAIIGRGMIHASASSRSRDRNAGGGFLIGVALIIVGYVGVFIGEIIKAAVSRQREYLADASAVQFTRQTHGLTGALKKIAGTTFRSHLNHPKAEDVSHMLFGAGRARLLFATHPPLHKRIKALDPTFDAKELKELERRWAENPPQGLDEDEALGLVSPRDLVSEGHAAMVGEQALARARATLPMPGEAMAVQGDAVIGLVGAPTDETVRQAEAILDLIPEELRRQAHDPQAVLPLVFGMLLAADPEVRTKQHAVLVQSFGKEVADAAWRRGESLTGLHPMLRLPLAQIAFPALRQRSADEGDRIITTLHTLATVDGHLDVSEFCLVRLLIEELYEARHRQPTWGRRRYSLADARTAAALLLATLAWVGHRDDATAAERAFHVGTARLFGGHPLPYAPPQHGIQTLEYVWGPLDGLNPADKQLLVSAMVDVISHDGRITVEEAELLRTVCSLLHCPLPPLVPEQVAA